MTNATCRGPSEHDLAQLDTLKDGLTELKNAYKGATLRPIQERAPEFTEGAAQPTQHKIRIAISAFSKKSGASSAAGVRRGTGEGDPIPDEMIFFEGELTDTHPFFETLLVKAGEKLWITNSSPKPPDLTLEVAVGLSVKQDNPQLFIVTGTGDLLLKAPFSGTNVGPTPVPYSFEVLIDRSGLT